MTKKRIQGAPADRGDNGIRGSTESGYTRPAIPPAIPEFNDARPITVPDHTHAQRNRKAQQQLQLFRKTTNGYEREYGDTLLKELDKNSPIAVTFETFFTNGGLKLEDITCECPLTPDAQNLAHLKTELPKVRSIPRTAAFTVRLTKPQYAQLDEAYQDRSLDNRMGGR